MSRTLLIRGLHVAAVVALLLTSGFAVAELRARDDANQICCDYTCDVFCKNPRENCLRDGECNPLTFPPATQEYTCCPGGDLE